MQIGDQHGIVAVAGRESAPVSMYLKHHISKHLLREASHLPCVLLVGLKVKLSSSSKGRYRQNAHRLRYLIALTSRSHSFSFYLSFFHATH